jgi:hypothetical protein
MATVAPTFNEDFVRVLPNHPAIAATPSKLRASDFTTLFLTLVSLLGSG